MWSDLGLSAFLIVDIYSKPIWVDLWEQLSFNLFNINTQADCSLKVQGEIIGQAMPVLDNSACSFI